MTEAKPDEATPGEATRVPDADPALLRSVAERALRHPYQAWFYGDSIGFEGLLAASELLADRGFADFVHGFLRGWAARDEPRRPDDNTAAGHALCAVAMERDDPQLRAAAERLGRYLGGRRRIDGVSVTFEDARRSVREPYGGEGLDSEGRRILADSGAGIYVDCLHFDPPFFAHLGRLTGDRAWLDLAVTEALGHGRLLRDDGTGLYHHFWLERTRRAYALGWGRGQGWALLGLLDVVEQLDASEVEVVGRDVVAQAALALATAMVARQREDGHWHAMVDEPDSGDETSTAAFMAAGFHRGVTLGILPAEVFLPAGERAWSATVRAIDASGLLTGVSAAVYSSTEPRHYHHVPRGLDVPWGQGPVLVAALARRAQTEPRAKVAQTTAKA